MTTAATPSASTIALVHARTAPEHLAAARELIMTFVAPTRDEPGCLQYELLDDLDDPDHVVILEEWADDASLAAHNTTPGYAELMGALLPLPEGQGSGLRLRRTS